MSATFDWQTTDRWYVSSWVIPATSYSTDQTNVTKLSTEGEAQWIAGWTLCFPLYLSFLYSTLYSKSCCAVICTVFSREEGASFLLLLTCLYSVYISISATWGGAHGVAAWLVIRSGTMQRLMAGYYWGNDEEEAMAKAVIKQLKDGNCWEDRMVFTLCCGHTSFDAYPDPAFNFNSDPTPTFHCDVDQDQAFMQIRILIKVTRICEIGLQTLHGPGWASAAPMWASSAPLWASKAPLWASAATYLHCEHTTSGWASTIYASTVSIQHPGWASTALLRIGITLMWIRLFILMRIWIRLPETAWTHADPDHPQTWVTPVNHFLLEQPQIQNVMTTFIFVSLSSFPHGG